MHCSHNTKIWLAYVTSAENNYCQLLRYMSIRVISCRNVYLALLKYKGLEPEWIKVLELSLTGVMFLMFLWFRLWKELILSSVLFGKTFRLKPECEHVSTFAAQHQVNRTVEDQFCKYELTELGLSAKMLRCLCHPLFKTSLAVSLNEQHNKYFLKAWFLPRYSKRRMILLKTSRGVLDNRR